MNKKIIITLILLGILVILAIIIGMIISTNKQVSIIYNEAEIDFKYSSLNFKIVQNSDQEKTLESKNEEIQVKINDNLKEAYESYSILKDYRMMAYKGQEVEYNQVQCFYYYDDVENRYTVITQINEESYLTIYIKPKENSNESAEDAFNKKNIQKILNTLEIKS